MLECLPFGRIATGFAFALGIMLLVLGLQLMVEQSMGWFLPFGGGKRPDVVVRIIGPSDNTTAYGKVARVLHASLSKIGESQEFTVEDNEKAKTIGSLETIVELDKLTGKSGSPFGVGIAQADVIYHYVFGGHPELANARTSSNIRSVARMFDEWLLIGAPSNTPTPAFISAEAVASATSACGQEVGTGSLVTAINLGRSMQAPWLSAVHDCSPGCFDTFSDDGQINISRQIKVAPNALCLKVRAPTVAQPGWRYLGIPTPAANSMVSVFDKSYSVVPPEEFATRYPDPNRATDLTTISVGAVLVVSREMPTKVVAAIQCLLDSWDDAVCAAPHKDAFDCGELHVPKVEPSTIDALMETGFCARMPRPPIEEAARHAIRFDNLPISRHGATIVSDLDPYSAFLVGLSLRQLQGFAICLLGTLVLVYAKIRRYLLGQTLFRLHRRTVRRWATRFLGFVAAHALIAILIWLAESHSQALLANDKFVAGGILEAGEWVVRYVVTGDGAINFQSPWALTFVASLKLGWGLAALALGYDIQSRARAYFKVFRMTHHVVVIGWNSGTPALLGELLNEHDCVVIPFRNVMAPESPNRHHITTVQDPITALDDESLRQAQITAADAVIILADRERAELLKIDVDAHTFRLVELYRRLEKEGNFGKKRVIAEIIQPENVPIVHRLGECGAGTFDSLCTLQFSSTFIAQMALKPALGHFVRELATTTDASNELYMVGASELRKYFDFASFENLRQRFAVGAGPNRVVPIGFQCGTDQKVLINPDPSESTVREGDQVIFLARNREHVIGVAEAVSREVKRRSSSPAPALTDELPFPDPGQQ